MSSDIRKPPGRPQFYEWNLGADRFVDTYITMDAALHLLDTRAARITASITPSSPLNVYLDKHLQFGMDRATALMLIPTATILCVTRNVDTGTSYLAITQTRQTERTIALWPADPAGNALA